LFTKKKHKKIEKNTLSRFLNGASLVETPHYSCSPISWSAFFYKNFFFKNLSPFIFLSWCFVLKHYAEVPKQNAKRMLQCQLIGEPWYFFNVTSLPVHIFESSFDLNMFSLPAHLFAMFVRSTVEESPPLPEDPQETAVPSVFLATHASPPHITSAILVRSTVVQWWVGNFLLFPFFSKNVITFLKKVSYR